jgi:hypothetical protein
MAQLFSHMGRKSTQPRLFQSIKPQNQMMQNLIDIESRTGGDRWLRALDDELVKQKRTAPVHEGSTAIERYVKSPLRDTYNSLFGKPRQQVFGETSLGGGDKTVHVNPEPKFLKPYSQSLKGRNPYVQSLVDTMRHELGGHVMENITPGHQVLESEENELTAKNLVGEQSGLTKRASDVQQYFGLLPRPDKDY